MGKFNFSRAWRFDQSNRLVDLDYLDGQDFNAFLDEKLEEVEVDIDPIIRLESVRQPVQRRIVGPVAQAADIPVFTANPAYDAVTYSKAYAINGDQYPADWPLESPGRKTLGSNFYYATPLGSSQTIRFQTASDRFAMSFFYYDPAYAGIQMFVNGAPVNTDQVHFTLASGSTIPTFVFPDARPREIEIVTSAMVGGVYVPEKYRVRKPSPALTPETMIFGASWALGAVQSTVVEPNVQGLGARLPFALGIEKSTYMDAIGGTGWLTGAANDTFVARLPLNNGMGLEYVILINPFENDIFGGQTPAAVSNAMCTAIESFTAANPGVRFIIAEAMRIPAFASVVANMESARALAKARLDTTVGAYWIDTTDWITGTGYVGATSPTGNSSVYIGSDAAHATPEGSRYFIDRVADAVRVAFLDDGTLLNTRINV